jgi:alcohol dehydrogenase class IV
MPAPLTLETPEPIAAFALGRLPRIEFGRGRLQRLPTLAARHGSRLLIVTGARSFTDQTAWPALQAALRAHGLEYALARICGEPTPEEIDQWVQHCRGDLPAVVVGIGGGSVLDAAKAIAGLLIPGNSVMDHLEGVGPEHPYRGPATPFIAVPTTAGTGSEATRNAVLTRLGAQGFKKSFRDEALVAEYAIIDPDLLATCPPAQIAANGMDALTQLLESYVSIRANPVTEALAWQGLVAVRTGLLSWYQQGAAATQAQEQMALAALLSGICLAHTGLGSVHGLAQPLGSFYPIGHGVVCGTLLEAALRVNLEALRARAPTHPALRKYAAVGRLFQHTTPSTVPLPDRLPDPLPDTGESGMTSDEHAQDSLLDTLAKWTQLLDMPALTHLGVVPQDLPRIVAHARGSSMQTNPIVLEDREIQRILQLRLYAHRGAPGEATQHPGPGPGPG